jgi:hypothetical protein
MCKSEAEGGQRCAAHTRKALAKAIERRDRDPRPSTYDGVRAAEAEHASTSAGRREFEQRLANPRLDWADQYALKKTLARGAEIRERNLAVQDALRDQVAQASTSAVTAPEGFREVTDPTFEFDVNAPDGDGYEMPVYSGTAAGALRRLKPGTYDGLGYDGNPVQVIVGKSAARVFTESPDPAQTTTIN